ncbi:hypothetical protein, partial [Pseudomonas syringae]|uniref:hypothetical protein n=1 Tax=Pseudomonas syringae TaxID=317 RepID=UPI000EFF5D3D
MTTGRLSDGPSCEMDKLIVQIVGKKHSDQQQVLLVGSDGNRLYQAKSERLVNELFSSTLKVWDHIDGGRLDLQVATLEGE